MKIVYNEKFVLHEGGKLVFFRFIRVIVAILVRILNGRPHFQNQNLLPKNENYILVGPHRTWWDPLYFALAASPRQFSFMAKEELFKNPILRFILKHANAFPVDRKDPGPSAIKIPVRQLKNTHLSLIMFPSGTRHSKQLKGGVALIAKLAKVPLVPVVYQGPLTFKDFLKRKKVYVRFGEPIDVSDITKVDHAGIAEVEHRMQVAFDELDHELNPQFVYIPTPVPEGDQEE